MDSAALLLLLLRPLLPPTPPLVLEVLVPCWVVVLLQLERLKRIIGKGFKEGFYKAMMRSNQGSGRDDL